MPRTPPVDLASDLLQRLLRGEAPAPADLDALLEARAPENAYLDFKSGGIIEREKGKTPIPGHPVTFDGKVRQHVCGFANADGGVLIVGVPEAPKWTNPITGVVEPDPRVRRHVDGVPGVDTARLLTLARDAVSRLRPGLAVHVPIHVVEHPSGLVLVIAVPRADSMVTCVEQERVVHYLRIGDSTVHAPAYLVEDLVLGRRRRPTFEAELVNPSYEKGARDAAALGVVVKLKNTGLVWMERTQAGIVGYVENPGGEPVGDHIAPYLDIRPHHEPIRRIRVFPMENWPSNRESTAPFGVARASAPALLFEPQPPFLWCGAVYVVHHNQPPAWFQIVWLVKDRNAPPDAWILPAVNRRPIVAVHYQRKGVWQPHIDYLTFEEGSDGAIQTVALLPER